MVGVICVGCLCCVVRFMCVICWCLVCVLCCVVGSWWRMLSGLFVGLMSCVCVMVGWVYCLCNVVWKIGSCRKLICM